MIFGLIYVIPPTRTNYFGNAFFTIYYRGMDGARAWPEDRTRYSQRAGRWEMIFPTGRDGPTKDKYVFQRARLGRQKGNEFKKRRIILLVSPGRYKKRRSFQTDASG